MTTEKRIMAAFAKDCEQHPRKFIYCQEYNNSMQSQFMMMVGARASDMGVDFENVEIFEMIQMDHDSFPMNPIHQPVSAMTLAQKDDIDNRWFSVGNIAKAEKDNG